MLRSMTSRVLVSTASSREMWPTIPELSTKWVIGPTSSVCANSHEDIGLHRHVALDRDGPFGPPLRRP